MLCLGDVCSHILGDCVLHGCILLVVLLMVTTLLLQNEARQMNHQEVVEEDRRNKLPPNWEARKRQAEWVLEDERKRKEAEERVITFVS